MDSQDVLKFKRDFAPTDEYLSDLEANKIYFPLKTEAQRIWLSLIVFISQPIHLVDKIYVV